VTAGPAGRQQRPGDLVAVFNQVVTEFGAAIVAIDYGSLEKRE
jgi:hypothetical protein